MSAEPPLRPSLLAGILLAAALGAVSGYLAWHHLLREPEPAAPVALLPERPPPAENLVGTRRPDFTLPDLDGRPRAVDEWHGKVLLINFWATWCAPCREEMPLLVDLQREFGSRGLQVIGVAMDDVEAVRAFAAEFGVDYPLLTGQQPVMELVRRYGNRLGAIPYTAVVGRDGRLAHLQAGLLHRDEILPVLEALY